MPKQPHAAAADAAPRDDVARPYLNYLYAATLTGRPSSAQIAVAAAIATEHQRSGAARLTYAELAQRAGCTKRNAIRCVNRLVLEGFITVTMGDRGNIYSPTIAKGEAHDAAWRQWKADWQKGARRAFPAT